ncbi:MAG: tyrosine-type recombinase/integrase [Alphaproteobacteria bacterium]|nr:tyrosine-type recombinase/integrase [Alphaproteobacteria bacterium]
MLRRAHAASGVAPPSGEVRCHVFRHSVAMNLLQGGTALADIGNLLRHHSAQTTTIYARHDIEALRSLARPWPVETVR